MAVCVKVAIKLPTLLPIDAVTLLFAPPPNATYMSLWSKINGNPAMLTEEVKSPADTSLEKYKT